jgi:hypothetical protein
MDLTGFTAVVMVFLVPLVAIGAYAAYRMRKLQTEERLAAISRGVDIPMSPDLTPHARSRRAGILLVSGGLGYMIAFYLIGRVEPDAITAAALGIIPVAIGIGCFVDATLVRRETRA